LAKAGNTMIRLSRKGVMIWIGLMLFIAGWMFVLGILVGRGMAPVNLDAGKLEQELAALKARMLRQEQAQVDARASGQNGGQSDLGFYEALKDPKAEKPFAPLPKPKPVKTPSAAAKSAAVAPPPVSAPKPVPQPKPKPKPKPVVKPQPAPQLAPKPAAAARAKPAGGKFTVQVAALKDPGSAANLVAELRKKEFRAYQIRTEVSGKGVWYRVRVGAFTDRSHAEATAGRLKAQRYGAMVVRSQ
jgi:cell division septation protein DedD